ncbi:MAG: hypothetical protein EOO60_14070, partial [Hymenobacter sp.]
MDGKKEQTRYYGQLKLKFNKGAVLFVLFGLLLNNTAATPPVPPRPDFAALYRPVANRFEVVTRREGDSLRLLLNRPASPVGQILPTLRLTVWSNYDAKQPVLQ